MKPCGNCGYPLDETESAGMHEFQGVLWNDVNIKIIQAEAIRKAAQYTHLRDGQGTCSFESLLKYADQLEGKQ